MLWRRRGVNSDNVRQMFLQTVKISSQESLQGLIFQSSSLVQAHSDVSGMRARRELHAW